jgi:uncharacterized membrane protein required for colicin V production
VAAVTGFLAGLRRGVILSLAAIAAALGALGLAIHFSPGVAAYADARWHADAAVSSFLQHYMPLPDGSGQIPYSATALQLYLQQVQTQGTASAPYAASLRSMLAGAPPPAAPASTLGGVVDAALAQRLVAAGAFTAVVVAAEAALWLLAVLILGGAARRGWAGGVNALLGALLGMVERLVESAAALALLASLSVFPASSGLAAAIHHSRWAPLLLTALRRSVPAADHWLRSWLLWV